MLDKPELKDGAKRAVAKHEYPGLLQILLVREDLGEGILPLKERGDERLTVR
ncbi:hypothetical protein FACS1894126_1330 [Alphaproteobacteria bacterium]|nr:hypothetical protein FACS1894126_1330 [Alphaproteobacteria bacterium]